MRRNRKRAENAERKLARIEQELAVALQLLQEHKDVHGPAESHETQLAFAGDEETQRKIETVAQDWRRRRDAALRW